MKNLNVTNACYIRETISHLDLDDEIRFIDQPIRTVQEEVHHGLLVRVNSQGQMFIAAAVQTKFIRRHGHGLELFQILCDFIYTCPVNVLVILDLLKRPESKSSMICQILNLF
jgi:hypothetical protein